MKCVKIEQKEKSKTKLQNLMNKIEELRNRFTEQKKTVELVDINVFSKNIIVQLWQTNSKSTREPAQ